MYNNDIYPALQTFGIERLRKEQERALTPILAGRDVLVRLRTGGGKSLLYQLPTLLDEPGSLTLVFSPLRALQRDQVQALERRGVHAALLNSDLSTSMHADILRDFAVNGGLLYLAPEQLRREDVRTALAAAHVRRVVVDEAHILPQVEHGFRAVHRIAARTPAGAGVHRDRYALRPQLHRRAAVHARPETLAVSDRKEEY